MAEETKPEVKTTKPKRSRIVDIVIGVIIVVICLVLAKSLLNQLSLKHEVKSATAVTNQALNDIRHQKGQAVHDAGNKTFQAQNSAANLTAQFKAASAFTLSTPAIDRQTVTNDNKDGQAVSIIYKFPKPVLYIRIIVVKAKGADKFQIVNLSANTTEKPLLDNKY
jgi:hypothetical protein